MNEWMVFEIRADQEKFTMIRTSDIFQITQVGVDNCWLYLRDSSSYNVKGCVKDYYEKLK